LAAPAAPGSLMRTTLRQAHAHYVRVTQHGIMQVNNQNSFDNVAVGSGHGMDLYSSWNGAAPTGSLYSSYNDAGVAGSLYSS